MHTETEQSELFARLVEIGSGSYGTIAGTGGGGGRAGGDREPEMLYDRHGVLVVRIGELAVKAHQPDRVYGRPFAQRVALAGTLPQVLAPLGPPLLLLDGHTVTVAPYGQPVDPLGRLPWAEGARLLATLHNTPVPMDAPSWGRPERVARVVARMDATDAPELVTAAAEVRRAFATLPAWVRGESAPPARSADDHLLHGDWHLGQMVRTRAGYWRLIDIEDLGRGDPAWDLARPAALYSAGVLAPADWEVFLDAYRAAGGAAVPADGDPWAALEMPARSLAVQIAATCVRTAREEDRPLDGAEEALIDTCRRISRMRDRA
ncbi:MULTISPECIES: phosphotransferase family protein [Thermomonosporaceae]|uniref:phosphotransferase family protein n=1 Tax=Thermomonosporaceae TaxID=2012 RepID=UPI00255AF9C6|nr:MULTISPECIES: phosphotransferase [Thermomonosporaceae]MDL4774938.1 phosphotransferase [Actinomadura xylanilytica]